jgi:hypothetical protein
MHVVRGCRAAPESGEAMNHQAGPGSGGADSTAPEGTAADSTAPEGTAAEGTAPEDAVAEGTRPAETSAGQTGAGETNGQAGAPEAPRPDTGEPRVDAALTLLDRLGELPVTDHAAVFEQVHAELTAVLGQLDPETADTDL